MGLRTFATTDLHLASWLVVHGCTMSHTDSTDPDHVLFCFSPRPDPQLIAAFADSEATIKLHDFIRAMRKLKQALFTRAV